MQKTISTSSLPKQIVLTPQIERYDYDTQLSFLPVINKRIEQAENQKKYFKTVIDSHVDNQTSDVSENATNQLQHDLNIVALEREEKLVTRLVHARLRITEYKTYGTCRITGRLIESNRLESMPHITLSLKGKEIEKLKKK
ncbi:MAG: RNA polymerase-binding transcription factor DksA [Candidatus Paceibacteria bacterium]|jgi:RNA polymerase-binding transcription factor DksA